MRERPAGSGRWELRVFAGKDPVTGRDQRISRVVRGTKRQAESKLAELVAGTANGERAGTDATVEVLLDRYLEHLERQGLSPTTLLAYRRYIKLHIVPVLGVVPVRKLTAWDLDRLYGAMGEKGLGAATIRQTHAILSGALKQATRWGWVPTNVAKSASPPKARAARVVAPTGDEVRRLIDLAEQRDPVLAAAITLAAVTGARRGEIAALRWADVNLATGMLRIARSLADLPGGVIEKDTKSHQERVLALGQVGSAVLAKHRAAVEGRAAAAGVELDPAGSAFVFSDRLDGATPIRPDRMTGFFTRLRDDLDLPHVHFHGLRHFAATELARRGDVGVRTIAGRLGHADASVTLRVYSAFFPAADAQAAEHLGDALRSNP